jgi:hypothetical protein
VLQVFSYCKRVSNFLVWKRLSHDFTFKMKFLQLPEKHVTWLCLRRWPFMILMAVRMLASGLWFMSDEEFSNKFITCWYCQGYSPWCSSSSSITVVYPLKSTQGGEKIRSQKTAGITTLITHNSIMLSVCTCILGEYNFKGNNKYVIIDYAASSQLQVYGWLSYYISLCNIMQLCSCLLLNMYSKFKVS